MPFSLVEEMARIMNLSPAQREAELPHTQERRKKFLFAAKGEQYSTILNQELLLRAAVEADKRFSQVHHAESWKGFWMAYGIGAIAEHHRCTEEILHGLEHRLLKPEEAIEEIALKSESFDEEKTKEEK